jgi:hypothetical protein
MLLLGACASEEMSAGGGGFGGETLSGVVVGTSGKGISDASVRLRASGSLDATALREGWTDSTGHFRLDLPSGIALRLEVAGRDKSDSVRALVDLDPGCAPGRILAEAPSSRALRLRDSSGRPVGATLKAYGLGRTLATDDSGRADLTGWPMADLWVRATLKNGDAHDLFVPSAGGELKVGAGWLVDDFEGNQSRTRLGSLIGGGWWYVAAQGTDSQTVRDIGSMRDSSDAHAGKASLHANFVFASKSSGYGLVGFHFGLTEADPVDLSGLDSLVFWAKGQGDVRVEFVADTGGGVASHALVVQPDSTWRRFAVAASALSPVNSGRSWAVDSKRVRFLQFIVFQDADFRLDDLRYYGRALP